jgi:hypothetical protein
LESQVKAHHGGATFQSEPLRSKIEQLIAIIAESTRT